MRSIKLTSEWHTSMDHLSPYLKSYMFKIDELNIWITIFSHVCVCVCEGLTWRRITNYQHNSPIAQDNRMKPEMLSIPLFEAYITSISLSWAFEMFPKYFYTLFYIVAFFWPTEVILWTQLNLPLITNVWSKKHVFIYLSWYYVQSKKNS